MTKAVLGVIGGSGVYDLPGLEDVREERIASPWGEPSDALRIGRIGGTTMVFLPRHGRGHRLSPSGHQLPRQHRRPEARRRHRPRLGLGLRLVQAPSSIPGLFVLVDQFVDRTARARELVLRQRLRRPCLDGASGRAAAAGRGSPRPRAAEGIAVRARRHLCLHGGAAVLEPRRVADLQGPRLRRHRHDQHARGEARPRGRDHLRHHRHGDRLRLLAPRARRGRRRRPSSRC